jgi:DNA-binding XRE family transcriptional regulator
LVYGNCKSFGGKLIGIIINHKRDKRMERNIGAKISSGRPQSTNRVCADALYIHRVGHGLTQTEFAVKVGLSIRTIQKIENDPEFLTTRRTAYKIADEIINNPPPTNTETLLLMDAWNNLNND